MVEYNLFVNTTEQSFRMGQPTNDLRIKQLAFELKLIGLFTQN